MLKLQEFNTIQEKKNQSSRGETKRKTNLQEEKKI